MPFKDKKKGSEYMKQYYRKNIEYKKQQVKEYRLKYPEKEKNWMLKRTFNISLEEYNELLVKQNGVCAICLKPESAKNKHGTIWQLAVDHCHNTNKNRGLLCSRCNTALGLMQDDPVTLERAKDYLIKHL